MNRWLITAGPTYEPIDAVRFIGNRSSGRVGTAIAAAAARGGASGNGSASNAQVTLLVGPVDSSVLKDLPENVTVERFTSAADLQALLRKRWPEHDVLVMAAAVADYRLHNVSSGKLPRSDVGESMRLTLSPTPDLVAEMSKIKRGDQRIIGFALEDPADLRERAMRKLSRKGLDAIVANPLETMDAETIAPTLFKADGSEQSPGSMPKAEFGRWIVEQATKL